MIYLLRVRLVAWLDRMAPPDLQHTDMGEVARAIADWLRPSSAR